MFVGKLIRVVAGVVDGVAGGLLDGASVLVRGGIATVTGTAEVLADSVDQALTSVYTEVKDAVNQAKSGRAEAKEEQAQ